MASQQQLNGGRRGRTARHMRGCMGSSIVKLKPNVFTLKQDVSFIKLVSATIHCNSNVISLRTACRAQINVYLNQNSSSHSGQKFTSSQWTLYSPSEIRQPCSECRFSFFTPSRWSIQKWKKPDCICGGLLSFSVLVMALALTRDRVRAEHCQEEWAHLASKSFLGHREESAQTAKKIKGGGGKRQYTQKLSQDQVWPRWSILAFTKSL